MQPNDKSSNNQSNQPVVDSQQMATANIVRHQIEEIYEHKAHPISQSTHQDYHPHRSISVEEWSKYHSAWQDYYQKYYEGYYNYYLSNAQQNGANADSVANQQTDQQPMQEQTKKLRSEINNKVKEKLKKTKKSRHFIPIFAGLAVMLIIALVQYNRLIIGTVSAYVSPGAIDPQNIIVDPNSTSVISKEPSLVIPRINVDVPVVYDVGNDHDSQMSAMEKGVAHFSIPGASSHPGEMGNTVIAGHSSNDIFGGGDYKFIFAQLEKLKPGDSIYANYNGVRYGYVVTKTEVVKPNQVDKLITESTKPTLTLVTCTPIGTAINRLLVTAEQVTPDPTNAKKPAVNASSEAQEMPSNAPTLFEWLAGLFT